MNVLISTEPLQFVESSRRLWSTNSSLLFRREKTVPNREFEVFFVFGLISPQGSLFHVICISFKGRSRLFKLYHFWRFPAVRLSILSECELCCRLLDCFSERSRYHRRLHRTGSILNPWIASTDLHCHPGNKMRHWCNIVRIFTRASAVKCAKCR